MSTTGARAVSWTERAAERSPSVQRSRSRSVEQARQIVEAARRLLAADDSGFTTQELAKEAGVALQTFYRYFAGKDELLLAVLEESIAEGCARMQERGAALDQPLDRLRLYVTGAIEALADEGAGSARFITAEHYRLHQIFPDELAAAARPFADMLVPEIEAAVAAGVLASGDIEHDAWFVTQLSMATFHHFAFATPDEPIDVVADQLWRFCLRALGGSAVS
ncbi:MAG: TetR/AcrR family transcriptional regulator [Acidimicrobiia bacterium]|nr:TetR/AcrR family transcriptional regulator [Acidimicrobiia bacterium]